MAFELPPLPYAYDALGPHMSSETLGFHHDKHHATYVTNLNNLVKDTPMASQSLEDIIVGVAGDASKAGIFNNAAQAWNHNHFWSWMKPGGGGTPSGDLASKIDADFGSFDKFAEEFTKASVGRFGSGWGWLVSESGTLKVTSTLNGDNPLTHGQVALLGIDVWEHSYYLDYQNRRPDYVKAFLDHLVNWDYVAELYAKA